MTRIDVGGNRAGTQTGYTAYGLNGQVRVLIEGINTTEGTGGAGFYFDYASLEEAFLGTAASRPKCRTPACRAQFIARSGSNQFQGEYHLDWYNNSLQGSNLPDEYTVPTAFNNAPIREHSNEIDRYYDHDINAGGPIKKDKVWFFGTYREQYNAVAQPNFQFDKTFDTKLWNAGRQGDLPDQPEEQVHRLLPVGPEGAAEPPAVRDLHLRVAGADLHAGLGQLGLQGRVERHGQRQAVSRSALRRLRLLLPAVHQQPRQLLLPRHRRG